MKMSVQQIELDSWDSKVKIRCHSYAGAVLNGPVALANPFTRCREVFHVGEKYRHMLFSCSPQKRNNIIELVWNVEDLLEIKNKSIISYTGRPNILWIEVASWWMKPTMRLSFFTILLQCGQNYKIRKNNILEALTGHYYFKHTQYATVRFLNGNTRYTGRNTGWFTEFSTVDKPLDIGKVQKLLIKP